MAQAWHTVKRRSMVIPVFSAVMRWSMSVSVSSTRLDQIDPVEVILLGPRSRPESR